MLDRWKDVADINKKCDKNSESTLWSWNCLLPQSLFRNGKITVNFQPFFDWMNLPPSCTTWLPQVSGWCSVAWNKQIEKGTLWHLTLARMQLTASLPASFNNDQCLLTKIMGERGEKGWREKRKESWQRGKRFKAGERGGGQREIEKMLGKEGSILELWNPGSGDTWSDEK